jgi:hypothetical protein
MFCVATGLVGIAVRAGIPKNIKFHNNHNNNNNNYDDSDNDNLSPTRLARAQLKFKVVVPALKLLKVSAPS